MAGGGPDEWSVCTVGIVSVSVAPGIDKVVGRCVGKNHGGFGFEVAFGGGSCREFVRSDKVAEQNGCFCGFGNCGGAGGTDGVGSVIGEVAVARGLEGCNLGFRGGSGAVAPNGARRPQGQACEDADDGDDGEEFDEGERRHGAARG